MRAEDSRLTGWKEIAAHLGSSVRTAQRWERFEGLPVYRHYHAKGSTSYAVIGELDAWLRGRSLQIRAVDGSVPSIRIMTDVIGQQDTLINQLRAVIEDQRRLGRAVMQAHAPTAVGPQAVELHAETFTRETEVA